MNSIKDLLVSSKDVNPDENVTSHLAENFDAAVRLLTKAFKRREAIYLFHI